MTGHIDVVVVWARTCLVLAAICTTVFPILYAFSPWWKSRLGQALMLQAVALAAAIDLTTVLRFWRPKNIHGFMWINGTILTLIAAASVMMTWMLWVNNHRRKTEALMSADSTTPQHLSPKRAMLSNNTYDVLKKATTVVLPGLAALYVALAQIWGLPHPTEVAGSVAAINVFLGLLLGMSSKAYNNSDERFDGTIDVEHREDGTKVVSMGLNNLVDPHEIANMDQVTFKVNK